MQAVIEGLKATALGKRSSRALRSAFIRASSQRREDVLARAAWEMGVGSSRVLGQDEIGDAAPMIEGAAPGEQRVEREADGTRQIGAQASTRRKLAYSGENQRGVPSAGS